MDVQQKPIYQFLEGSGKTFIIPVYQRDYAWKVTNCQKLWEDLVDLNNNERPDHFLGTIVTIGKGYDEYTIIDGQQRITTISILLLALHNYLKNKELSDEEKNLPEQINEFLINKYSNENNKRIRLKPNKQDKQHFEDLFDGKYDNIDSNIINNYNFFIDKLNSNELSPANLYNAFKQLKIVLIHLNREFDDPQLIFESLNSTGVDLTAGDLIRNYILMDLESHIQENYYNKYWINIEKNTNDLAEFIRNFLIFQNKQWVKRDDVYLVFKKYALYNEKEKILNDLLYFSEIYSWLNQIKPHSDLDINNRLIRLNQLEFTVTYPYLLDLFNDYKNNVINKETLLDVLKNLESYIFRKIFVDSTTQGLNKLFITLSKEIKKEESWKSKYLDIFNYIILEKKISQRFPTDDEFRNALLLREVFKLQSKNKKFLLESLENYNSAYSINLDDLTIEHIMPQKPTKEWKERLGENWYDIHNKYLHTLGNLSLTAKNSEMSNRTIEEKQRIDFQTSKLKLNYNLDKINEWNEKTILARGENLVTEALNIWPYPSTTFVKSVPDEQLFDLTTEDDFTGNKPLNLYLENENPILLKTWKDLLVHTCKFLFKYSPTQFNELQNSNEFKWYFDVKKPIRRPAEFLPGKVVESNMSASSIIHFLSNLCDKMNYPKEKISFSLKIKE